jgi:hypothetical protein
VSPICHHTEPARKTLCLLFSGSTCRIELVSVPILRLVRKFALLRHELLLKLITMTTSTRIVIPLAKGGSKTPKPYAFVCLHRFFCKQVTSPGIVSLDNMQLVSTLCFLLIARIHARNVGDPTGLSLRGAESVNAGPTEGDEGEGKRRGLVDESCSDVSGWYDADGSDYNCDWYKAANSYCARYFNALHEKADFTDKSRPAHHQCYIDGERWSRPTYWVRTDIKQPVGPKH